MWLLLLLIPLVPSSAQNSNIDNASSWVFEFLNNNEETSNRLNQEPSKPTTNKPFKINISSDANLFCNTTDGKEGKCVQPQFCEKEQPVRDPSTLFNYREGDCSYLLPCCPLNQIKKVPRKTNKLLLGCGWSNPGGYRLRTLDSDPTGFSDFADFPWMVALLKNTYGNTWNPQDYIGGGTLIHQSVVLTVAHKVQDKKPSELKCRAGEWDFKLEQEIASHQDRNVQRISIHNQFLYLRAHYDAALLFLESPFKLKDMYHIGVACLARDMPAPGTLCYSMGWGSSFNDTNNTNLLKKIQLPTVDPDTCQQQLRKTRLGSNYELHQTLFCAGGEAGKDTCIGDGGSSFVCPIPSKGQPLRKYAVYGMVVYGVDCGQANVPGVYAKVSTLINWIDDEMRGEQLETSAYTV